MRLARALSFALAALVASAPALAQSPAPTASAPPGVAPASGPVSNAPAPSEALAELRSRGIVQGGGSSALAAPTSQGQFLTLIDRAVPSTVTPLPTASRKYYAIPVSRAQAKGLLSGIPAQPERPISREDAALLAIRQAYVERVIPGGARPRVPPAIADIDQIAPRARPAVVQAVELGLIATTRDNRFRPKDPLTYGEAVVITAQLRRAADVKAEGAGAR
ncbi:MAG TPA: S-layer homology domain-containing protein [Candidatus Elarobacter sp.]|nr:S-layer homology domain-containing protein [Dongiaceae bacterium]HZW53284.1 S-layer homology domain-containing protein [Candidatus Elarobacter sp.]